jgi:TM2 domain-containing membrane protein YozV
VIGFVGGRVLEITRRPTGTTNEESNMGLVLWLIAVVIGIVGIVQLLQGQIILGIVLLVVAFLVGPGGYRVFRSRTA